MASKKDGPGPQEVVDPHAESESALAAVAFQKSSSASMPMAVAVAQRSPGYRFAYIEGRAVHFSVFGPTVAEAMNAVSLLKLTVGWKGVLCYSRGRPVDAHRLLEVLDCYVAATRCVDRRAHCHAVIDDPMIPRAPAYYGGITIAMSRANPPLIKEVVIARYAFPCVRLQSRFRFQPDHPATLRNQIQAAAAAQDYDVCPFFDADAFEVVGERREQHEVFDRY